MIKLALRHRAAIGAIVATACATLAACSGSVSSDRPSDPEIEAAVRAAILTEGKDKVMSVENYKKLNGYLSPDKTYTADVSYDLVFAHSYKELKREYNVDESKAGVEMTPLENFLVTFMYANERWEAGRHFPRSEKVPFIKTEKGWVISAP